MVKKVAFFCVVCINDFLFRFRFDFLLVCIFIATEHVRVHMLVVHGSSREANKHGIDGRYDLSVR